MSSHKKRRKKHIKKGQNNKGTNSTSRQIIEGTAGAITGETTGEIAGAVAGETTGKIAEQTAKKTGEETAGETTSSTIGAIAGKTTSSKSGKKTSETTSQTTGETTSSTTGAATGGTISSILDSLTIEEVTKIRLILGAIGDLNVAKLSLLGLAINETDRVYYDNRLKPLIDAIFNLGLATGNIATAVNYYQSNLYSEKHEIKKALDITYEIHDCVEIAVRILKCRLKYYEENADWCE